MACYDQTYTFLRLHYYYCKLQPINKYYCSTFATDTAHTCGWSLSTESSSLSVVCTLYASGGIPLHNFLLQILYYIWGLMQGRAAREK